MTVEQIWHTFHGPLRQFIRRRVTDEQVAEDILQDVFVKVHTHIDTVQHADRLPGWIYRLTRNAIIDHYRRSRPTTALPDTMPMPEIELEAAAEQTLLPSVRAMVEQLPPAYREALLLSEYEGLTQREIAVRLGLSLSGAKSRVQRGRQQLKQMLLDCCHFQFDQYGTIIDYQPKCGCCNAAVIAGQDDIQTR